MCRGADGLTKFAYFLWLSVNSGNLGKIELMNFPKYQSV